MTELNKTQKLIVIETIKSWPKSIDGKKLLEILDGFAKRILQAKE